MQEPLNEQKYTPSIDLAIFHLFICAIMMDGLYITEENYDTLAPLRLYLTLILCATIIASNSLKIFFSKSNAATIIYTGAHLIVLCYALFLSKIFGGDFYFFTEEKLISYLLISIFFGHSLSTCFATYINAQKTTSSSIYIPLFFVGSFIYLLVSKSIIFGDVPYFDFGNVKEETRLYSQSTSALFSVGAIYFLTSTHKYSILKSLPSFIFSCACLYFSAMGGARGDFAIGLILYISILLRFRSAYSVLAFILLASTIVYFIVHPAFIENFFIIDRFLVVVETESYGDRDILWGQSVDLLGNKFFCLSFGCGFNFFQHYYSYEYGMYPHNIAIEFIITYGIIIFIPATAMAIKGITVIAKDVRIDSFFIYFIIYILLISLKSGSLIGFMSIPIIIFCAFIPFYYKSVNAPI